MPLSINLIYFVQTTDNWQLTNNIQLPAEHGCACKDPWQVIQEILCDRLASMVFLPTWSGQYECTNKTAASKHEMLQFIDY